MAEKQCDNCIHWDKELVEKEIPLDCGTPRYTGIPDYTSVCKKRLLRTSYKSICKWFEEIK